jgi:radical SAM protein with 4Fe4S-binding SPASM domain
MTRAHVPHSLVWEITARCDLSCAHCYNVWGARGVSAPCELDHDGAARVLERLVHHRQRIRALTLTGGEPLLHGALEELVGMARRALPRVQLTVSTNGQRLDGARARGLRTAGIDAIQITLLSTDPVVHDSMVGVPGAQRRTMAAIAAAREAGLGVAVFFVATARNIETWVGTAKLAVSLGADVVVFNRFQPGGRALDDWRALTPSRDQIMRAIDQIDELSRQVAVRLGTPIPPCERRVVRHDEIMACPIGTTAAYPAITPDGQLRPCNHCPEVAGSLLEHPLEELLAEAPCAAPDELPLECLDCHHARACRGGCVGARRLARAQIYALDRCNDDLLPDVVD